MGQTTETKMRGKKMHLQVPWCVRCDYHRWHKITHPLDRRSRRFDYSIARRVSVPNRVSFDRLDRQLSENVSLGVESRNHTCGEADL